MKNTISISGLKWAFLIISVLMVIQSCNKKGAENANCLPAIIPDSLRFNIVDKNTGEDLFFSNTPVYTTNQIHFLIDDMATNISPVVKTSVSLGKHFLIRFGGYNKTGSLKTYIAGKLQYNIEYTMREDKTTGCLRIVLDKIKVNGGQVETNLKDRVVLLKM
ncbi:hypothetical protein DU508_16480 [Pedobacter chinensis]|uniref:Uncharacterized protein n=1 Tax=Pedobacter chinensis TaxID=2282421 RepID=A0A369PXC3_9SPHI|nr:hypothetical protein [Pedobacter chinensis]RDC55855.1 hypothetical protein DU508_16480 [Pedobacter chinensis]